MRLCRREFGYSITYHQMRQLYGLNRVRYVSTSWVHGRAVRDKEDLDELRREFAKTLGTIISDKDNLGPIYFGKCLPLLLITYR